MPTIYDAIRAQGFEPPDFIQPGKTMRFSTNGKTSDKAGWVYLFADEQGASFGCNRSGEKHVWQAARDKPFNEAEQAEFRLKIKAASKASYVEREAGYGVAMGKARGEWAAAVPASESHPYLRRKGINPNMARVDTKGLLLIPVYGENNEIQSLQRIASDGQKRFFTGCKMRGGHVWIGEPKDGEALLLAEGFGTSDTLHRATGHAVCVCFSAGNLKVVAEQVRKRYPLAQLLICADDDTKTTGNPGRTKATEAAEAVAGKVVLPVFIDQDGGDFNDLELAEGLEAVQIQFKFMELPVVRPAFAVPALSGTDSRDGTNSTRPLSELGNAMRLQDAHGGNIYFVHDAKAWLHWNGGAWVC